MSCRVLVIPEDPTLNGYILKPLVERVLAAAGRPKARVVVLTNPRLRGYDHAVSAIREELLVRYNHWDVWLFFPDADRAVALNELEQHVGKSGVTLFCCPAEPEIEAWLLAGFRDEIPLPWGDVRKHPRLKEEVFDDFLARFGNQQAAGEGRERLMLETLKSYAALRRLCPEIAGLEDRLRIFFGSGATESTTR
jgi:hypothetical protein